MDETISIYLSYVPQDAQLHDDLVCKCSGSMTAKFDTYLANGSRVFSFIDQGKGFAGCS